MFLLPSSHLDPHVIQCALNTKLFALFPLSLLFTSSMVAIFNPDITLVKNCYGRVTCNWRSATNVVWGHQPPLFAGRRKINADSEARQFKRAVGIMKLPNPIRVNFHQGGRPICESCGKNICVRHSLASRRSGSFLVCGPELLLRVNNGPPQMPCAISSPS